MTPETKHDRLETESGHHDALHEKLDPEGEISVKNVSGSGLQWRLPSLQSVTDDHPLESWKTPTGQGQRAQGTPESVMIPQLPPPPPHHHHHHHKKGGSSRIARACRSQGPCLPPHHPPKGGKREGDLVSPHERPPPLPPRRSRHSEGMGSDQGGGAGWRGR